MNFDAFYFIAWLVYEQVAIAALDMGDDALALVRSSAGSFCSSDQAFAFNRLTRFRKKSRDLTGHMFSSIP